MKKKISLIVICTLLLLFSCIGSDNNERTPDEKEIIICFDEGFETSDENNFFTKITSCISTAYEFLTIDGEPFINLYLGISDAIKSFDSYDSSVIYDYKLVLKNEILSSDVLQSYTIENFISDDYLLNMNDFYPYYPPKEAYKNSFLLKINKPTTDKGALYISVFNKEILDKDGFLLPIGITKILTTFYKKSSLNGKDYFVFSSEMGKTITIAF